MEMWGIVFLIIILIALSLAVIFALWRSFVSERDTARRQHLMERRLLKKLGKKKRGKERAM